MAKILYSARLEDDSEKTGYIEADSEQEALNRLKEKGLKDIHLLETIAQARQRVDRNDLSNKEAEKRAQFEIKAIKGPSFKIFFLEVLRANKWLVCVELALLVFGLNNPWAFGLGIIALAATLGLPLFNYRNVRRFNNLMEANAIGDWATVRHLVDQLYSVVKKRPLDLWSLVVKSAYADAAEGNLQQGLNRLEQIRAQTQVIAPELVESQTAMLYHAAGNYPQFIEKMRQACAMANDSSSIYPLDLMMAEARLGNLEEAEKMMDQIDSSLLPPWGISFFDWTKGVIALRRNQPTALSLLQQAIQGLTIYNKNPALWTTLAMCTGHYALALARANQQAKAATALEQVWPMLKVHADKPLLSMLKQEIPQFLAY